MSNEYSKFFPDVEHGIKPLGSQVLVQGKLIPAKTTSGIALPDDYREKESYLIRIGKIVAVGDLAFKNRDTGAVWQEGEWAKVGDFVYAPASGSVISKMVNGERITFVLLNDVELIAKLDTLDGFTQFYF